MRHTLQSVATAQARKSRESYSFFQEWAAPFSKPPGDTLSWSRLFWRGSLDASMSCFSRRTGLKTFAFVRFNKNLCGFYRLHLPRRRGRLFQSPSQRSL